VRIDKRNEKLEPNFETVTLPLNEHWVAY